MKKATISILSFFLLFVFVSVFAGNNEGNPPAKSVSLSGKVIDKNNEEALVGALVRIEGTDFETYTDFEGNFKFEGLTPDKYKLKCSLISYNEFEKEIEVEKAKEHIDLTLENVVAK